MDRRGFLLRTGAVVIAVPPVLLLTACDEGDAGDGLTVSSTQSGHVHTIRVSCDDIANGDDVTYTSTNDNGHTHEVTITADQMVALAEGGTIEVQTNDSGHPHGWVIDGGRC